MDYSTDGLPEEIFVNLTTGEISEATSAKPSIYVAIPSARDWKWQFGISVSLLMAHLTTMMHQGKIEKAILNVRHGSILSQNRQDLVKEAIDRDYTHILWIDDDMKFPPTIAETLLSHDKSIVAVNACKKQMDTVWCALDFEGKFIDSSGKTGLEEVYQVGLGISLMKTEILAKLAPPHFEIIWLEEHGRYLGEDMYLFEKLKMIGEKIYIDHDVSNLISHVGDYEYRVAAK